MSGLLKTGYKGGEPKLTVEQETALKDHVANSIYGYQIGREKSTPLSSYSVWLLFSFLHDVFSVHGGVRCQYKQVSADPGFARNHQRRCRNDSRECDRSHHSINLATVGDPCKLPNHAERLLRCQTTGKVQQFEYCDRRAMGYRGVESRTVFSAKGRVIQDP